MKRLLLILAVAVTVAGTVFLIRSNALHRILALAGRADALGEDGISTPPPVAGSKSAKSVALAPVPAISAATLQAMPAELLVARLRAAQLPDGVIRAIVTAHVGAAWEARVRDMAASRAQVPYWEKQPLDALRGEVLAEMHDTMQRDRLRVNELLGQATEVSLEVMQLRMQYGDLPPDKVMRLQQIDSDYKVMVDKVSGSVGSVLLPVDRERLSYLDAEKDKDIRALLDGQAYDEYTLRTSPSAGVLRATLKNFEPTEAEFRALFALQHAFDQKHGAAVPGVRIGPAMLRARLEAQKELKTEMASVLSPNRRADFERATQ